MQPVQRAGKHATRAKHRSAGKHSTSAKHRKTCNQSEAQKNATNAKRKKTHRVSKMSLVFALLPTGQRRVLRTSHREFLRDLTDTMFMFPSNRISLLWEMSLDTPFCLEAAIWNQIISVRLFCSLFFSSHLTILDEQVANFAVWSGKTNDHLYRVLQLFTLSR